MTGGEFLRWVQEYRKSGLIPGDVTGDELARALTSSLHGNPRVRCARGIAQEVIHGMVQDLRSSLPAEADTDDIIRACFHWLRMDDEMRRPPLLEAPCLVQWSGAEKVQKGVYRPRTAYDFDQPGYCVLFERYWAKRDAIDFLNYETYRLSYVSFPPNIQFHVCVEHKGAKGEIDVDGNELQGRTIPISYRTVGAKGLWLHKLDKVVVTVQQKEPEPEPVAVPPKPVFGTPPPVEAAPVAKPRRSTPPPVPPTSAPPAKRSPFDFSKRDKIYLLFAAFFVGFLAVVAFSDASRKSKCAGTTAQHEPQSRASKKAKKHLLVSCKGGVFYADEESADYVNDAKSAAEATQRRRGLFTLHKARTVYPGELFFCVRKTSGYYLVKDTTGKEWLSPLGVLEETKPTPRSRYTTGKTEMLYTVQAPDFIHRKTPCTILEINKDKATIEVHDFDTGSPSTHTVPLQAVAPNK